MIIHLDTATIAFALIFLCAMTAIGYGLCVMSFDKGWCAGHEEERQAHIDERERVRQTAFIEGARKARLELGHGRVKNATGQHLECKFCGPLPGYDPNPKPCPHTEHGFHEGVVVDDKPWTIDPISLSAALHQAQAFTGQSCIQ